MSDKPIVTPGDKAGQRRAKGKPPLKDPNVDVTVDPVKKVLPPKGSPDRKKVADNNDQNIRDARHLAKKIEDNTKRAVKEAASRGRKAQRKAQHKVGEEAAKQIPRHKVKKITITVDNYETKHTPSEETPHPPPESNDD